MAMEDQRWRGGAVVRRLRGPSWRQTSARRPLPTRWWSSTNNASDTPIDLSTPLSRVLFDIQEIDSHIDVLTTRSAIPLLSHTREQTEASARIVAELDGQARSLNDSYRQLEKEVVQKHAEADEVRQVAARLWETLRLGRAVGRCLQLGRQLEVQHAELLASSAAGAGARKEDHGALVRSSHTILSPPADPRAQGARRGGPRARRRRRGPHAARRRRGAG